MPSPFRYPVDVFADRKHFAAEIRSLVQSADVIHVMDNPTIIPMLETRGKRVVVEHLGTRYRRDPESMSDYCVSIGALQVTGGLDFSGLPYLPLVGDLDLFARIRERRYRPGALRIAHAPTNRDFKSTTLIRDAIKGRDVVFDLIENLPWMDCLVRKARADVFVDELTLGYGANAIEAWGMGIPVISGIADPGFRAVMLDVFGELPFIEATPDTLDAVLDRVIADADLRQEYAALGLEHAQRVHSEEAVARRAVALYRA